MLLGLIIGFVIGAVVMYLLARNSPNHFLKFKKFADAVNERVKDKVIGV
jgi:gas vesicle protein